jgi:hypothetical protein
MLYHIDLVAEFLLLVAQFPHDIVAGILRLVRDAVHHAQPIGLVLGISV